MIKTHHSVHFGHRQIQLARDEWNRILGHVAQRFLYGMQYGEESPGQILEARARIEHRGAFRRGQRESRFDLDGNDSSRRLAAHTADSWTCINSTYHSPRLHRTTAICKYPAPSVRVSNQLY